MEYLLMIPAVLAGLTIGWLLRGGRIAQLGAAVEAAKQENARLVTEVAKSGQALDEFKNVNTDLTESVRALTGEMRAHEACAARVPVLEAELAKTRERLACETEKLARLETALEKEKEASAAQKALLDQAQARLTDAFGKLAADALKHNSTSFLELAQQNLATVQQAAKGDLEVRQKAVEELVNPLREQLARYEQQVRELESSRQKAYGQMTEALCTLNDRTGKLDLALRAPQSRGRWGEFQLQRVAELAGMIEHCDFDLQSSVQTESGRQRPDMTVNLPGGAQFFVDAKTPLDAYLDAVQIVDPAERKASLARHATRVRAHIDQLSDKNYWALTKTSPDFVILFLPGENFLSAALEHDPDLIEHGFRKKIMLASPTMLVALLRTAALSWRQEQLAANADKICVMARELYERLATMGDHFADLGKNLTRSVDCYNKTIGSLERNVLPKARAFPEMGVQPKEKLPEEFPPVVAEVRQLSALELIESAANAEPPA